MRQLRLSGIGRLTLVCLGAIQLLLLGLALNIVSVPTSIVFKLVLPMILLPSLFWWIWVDGQLSSRGRVWLRLVWGAYIAAMLSPIVILLMGARHLWDTLPVPVITWIMLWWMLMTFLSVVFVAVAAARFVWCRWPTSKRSRSSAKTDPPQDETAPASAIDRRTLLGRALIGAPLVLVGGGVARGIQQAGDYRIRRIRIRLPKLPNRLSGLTITHLSDLHVGRLFRPAFLPAMVEDANRLNSDIVAVTGDIIDHNIDYLPATMEAIGQLEHRYGRFIVTGNHDLIDSPQTFIDKMYERESGFLCDALRSVTIGGERMNVAGLFWSRHDRAAGLDPGHFQRVENTLASADPNIFTLALARHPHAFDALAERKVDLTLAGHTHGGQFMMKSPGAARPIGVGDLMFRYVWGEYRHDSSVLYVNAGVGNWFPLRINAPAEIVQIQLI